MPAPNARQPSLTETMSAAARRKGVTIQSVRRWRELGAPFVQIGRNWFCDPAQLDAWCEANGLGVGRGRPAGRPLGSVNRVRVDTIEESDEESSESFGNLPVQIQRATLRQRLADAEKKEMENRKRAGELVARADVEDMERGRLVAMRAGLLGLKTKIAARLAHLGEQREIEGIVDTEVRVMLEAYADGRSYPPEEEDPTP